MYRHGQGKRLHRGYDSAATAVTQSPASPLHTVVDEFRPEAEIVGLLQEGDNSRVRIPTSADDIELGEGRTTEAATVGAAIRGFEESAETHGRGRERDNAEGHQLRAFHIRAAEREAGGAACAAERMAGLERRDGLATGPYR